MIIDVKVEYALEDSRYGSILKAVARANPKLSPFEREVVIASTIENDWVIRYDDGVSCNQFENMRGGEDSVMRWLKRVAVKRAKSLREKRGKWITNMSRSIISGLELPMTLNKKETPAKLRALVKRKLKGCVLGAPKFRGGLTSVDLQRAGMVGIYKPDKPLVVKPVKRMTKNASGLRWGRWVYGEGWNAEGEQPCPWKTEKDVWKVAKGTWVWAAGRGLQHTIQGIASTCKAAMEAAVKARGDRKGGK